MAELEPVHLQLDGSTGDRFLVYGDDKGIHVEVHYQGDSLWMTQAQIAELFGRDVSVISRHISKILSDEELGLGTYLHDVQISTGGRPVALYSLDMVIAVGFKVSSPQAILFRKWSTDKLIQFATKGFVVDSVALKQPENRDRIAELRDIIRDIRSDEANVYRELRAICAMCQDYDGKSESWRKFYRNTQAKLVYAVCSNTPAELLFDRAHANEPNMGLQTWPNANIRKADVATSKNYLTEKEVKELNRLTTMLLDFFEDQLDIGRLKTMAEAVKKLDIQLQNLGRVVLRDGGSKSMASAKQYAESEYQKYKSAEKEIRHANADETIAAIKKTVKDLPATSNRRKNGASTKPKTQS